MQYVIIKYILDKLYFFWRRRRIAKNEENFVNKHKIQFYVIMFYYQ